MIVRCTCFISDVFNPPEQVSVGVYQYNRSQSPFHLKGLGVGFVTREVMWHKGEWTNEIGFNKIKQSYRSPNIISDDKKIFIDLVGDSSGSIR